MYGNPLSGSRLPSLNREQLAKKILKREFRLPSTGAPVSLSINFHWFLVVSSSQLFLKGVISCVTSVTSWFITVLTYRLTFVFARDHHWLRKMMRTCIFCSTYVGEQLFGEQVGRTLLRTNQSKTCGCHRIFIWENDFARRGSPPHESAIHACLHCQRGLASDRCLQWRCRGTPPRHAAQERSRAGQALPVIMGEAQGPGLYEHLVIHCVDRHKCNVAAFSPSDLQRGELWRVVY